MKRIQSLARVAAVVSFFLFLIAFVAYRAGAFDFFYLQPATMMGGTKTVAVMLPPPPAQPSVPASAAEPLDEP